MPVIIIVVAIIVIYFFVSNNKKNKIETNKISLENLNKKEVDKLLMIDLVDNLKKQFPSVVKKYPNSKPIALKLTSSQNKNNIFFDEKKYKGKHIIIATFYDEKKAEIVENETTVYICNQLDDVIINEFGDKELIVFS